MWAWRLPESLRRALPAAGGWATPSTRTCCSEPGGAGRAGAALHAGVALVLGGRDAAAEEGVMFDKMNLVPQNNKTPSPEKVI